MLAGCSESTDPADIPDALAKHYALEFTDDYVRVPDADLLDLTTSYTLEAWIRPHDVNGARFQHVISKWGDRDQASYTLEVHAGKLRACVHDGVGGALTLESVGTLANDVWQHVAVTLGEGVLRLYIDGVLDRVFENVRTPAVSAQPLCIGQECASDNARWPFDGQIDEVRIWRVKREEKLIVHRMYMRLRGWEYGLVGYWPFDEGNGTVTYDATASGLDGMISGATWTTDAAPLTR